MRQLLVSDLYPIAHEALRDERRFTARDIVAMAAFRCGGTTAEVHFGFTHNVRMYARYASLFYLRFSQDELEMLCGNFGFLPFKEPLICSFIDDAVGMSEWVSLAQKIQNDVTEQIKYFANSFGPAMAKNPGNRALGYSMFFEPNAWEVQLNGLEIYQNYKRFLPAALEPNHERI